MRIKSIVSLAVAGPLVGSGLVACASSPEPDQSGTGIHGTRSKEYAGMKDLASDSTAVVIGKVQSQETLVEDMPHTLSIFEIREPLQPHALAAALKRSKLDTTSLKTVAVRQLGTPEMSETPAPIFKQDGTVYMIFIRPSELPGDAAGQFYVTGGDAGIFTAGPDGNFAHKKGEVNDNIPAKISKNEVKNIK